MREFVYLTGDLEKTFFINEISSICEKFDKVVAIAYKGDRNKCNELAKKYGFTYYFTNDVKINISDLKQFYSWKKKDYVKDEILRNKEKGLKGFKKKLYIYFYGIYLIRVRKIIKKEIDTGNDIYLYSFWLSRPAFAVASFNRDRKTNIKRIVSRTHRYDLYEEENDLQYLPFRRFITENLDTLYFSSRDTIEYFKSKNYSAHNKYPEYKLSYLGTKMPGWRKEKKNENRIVLVSCAFIMPRKRLDLIIQVVKKIKDTGVNIKWIHIGNGESENEVKELAKKELQGIEYSFVGKLDDKDIYKLYQKENADFFINMSDSEGIPVSIMEVLSEGIPAIARDVGGNSDAVIDGYDGILINKNSISDTELSNLANRIIRIYNNKDEYMKMSRNAFKYWEHMFYGKRNMKNICEDIISNDVIKVVD